MSSTSPTSSDASSSRTPSSSLEVCICVPKKCKVCFRPAYCNNYGALSCDACKMFFRRVIVEKLHYVCHWANNCFDGFSEHSPKLPRCKACRFHRCQQIGMEFVIRETRGILEMRNDLDDDVARLITRLLTIDIGRAKTMSTCFTETDPTLEDLITRTSPSLAFTRPSGHIMRPQDWSFFALFTTVGQLLQMDFMDSLGLAEQQLILRKSVGKASLFSGAMRTFKGNGDRLMTVDGRDIYPDHIKHVLGVGSDEFLNRIRSLLVSRVIELNVTSEEYVLLTAILVCNPALEDLPTAARPILDAHRKKYSGALLQYCLVRYQHAGPSRFSDLLSLCHVIGRNFEDVQYLTMAFKLALKGQIQYKKLVEEII